MLEKNALDWLDMGEGFEKLDIYKNKKFQWIYSFFKTLLKRNEFPLYYYIILQIVFYYQICCIVIPKNDNTDYSNDYLIYVIQYSSNIIIPQSAINDFNSYRIIMIVITIFLFLVLSCFFIIISYMNNDKKPYFFTNYFKLFNRSNNNIMFNIFHLQKWN